MEFKIGDRIRVLDREKILDTHIDYPEFKQSLERYCGREGTIVSRYYDGTVDTWIYNAVFDFENNAINDCVFADWMLDVSVENETNKKDEIKIKLSDFDTLEKLLGYVDEKYGLYFDSKVARKKFLELQPTEEEIEVLQMLNSLGGELLYDNFDCYAIVCGKEFRMSMFDRFGEIMDYLNVTNNVVLQINLLLGEEN